MLSIIQSGALQGVNGVPVQVEVNSGEKGELRWVMVGLPDASVKESQNRVFSALGNSGFKSPTSRTTINLAPGHLKKEGPLYDLPIALGIIGATQQADLSRASEFLIAGELSLSGKTRPIHGALNLTLLARAMGKKGIILPKRSAFEATFVEAMDVYAVESLEQTVQFLSGKIDLEPLPSTDIESCIAQSWPYSLSDIKGQRVLKRVVEIAVAGGHNLLMVGPPGCGKSLIAKTLPGLYPSPSLEEWIEILKIKSACGLVGGKHKKLSRPFRSPHHSISDAGLLGGGTIPKPDEITLAHTGILFLDELPEFKRSVLELLRQPMEDGSVTVSRSGGKFTFPCRSVLVAAMNPCPCGYLGSNKQKCTCTSTQIQRYRSRVSGPLLDRMDLQVEVSMVPLEDLQEIDKNKEDITPKAKERIKKAREMQQERLGDVDMPIKLNGYASPKILDQRFKITIAEKRFLYHASEQLNLSARAYHKVLKVARTIADLDGEYQLKEKHLGEAIAYRCFDRHYF